MKKIMIVEDDTDLREAYVIILKREPFEIHVAEDGQVAVNLSEKNKYDLILLDLMMPNLDGVGFLSKSGIKAKSPDTRIILFSNLASGKEVNKALSLGAHKHILKSEVGMKELIELIHSELAEK